MADDRNPGRETNNDSKCYCHQSPRVSTTPHIARMLASRFVVFFSVLFRFQMSVVRPNCSQVIRIELPGTFVSYCAFAQDRF